MLDPRLRRVDRRAVVAHELVHLLRGLLPGGTPALVPQKEEHQVDDETALRLVPLEALAELARRVEYSPITVDDVAREFDVPNHVADRALAQLRHPRSAGLRWSIDPEEEGAA